MQISGRRVVSNFWSRSYVASTGEGRQNRQITSQGNVSREPEDVREIQLLLLLVVPEKTGSEPASPLHLAFAFVEQRLRNAAQPTCFCTPIYVGQACDVNAAALIFT